MTDKEKNNMKYFAHKQHMESINYFEKWYKEELNKINIVLTTALKNANKGYRQKLEEIEND